jgi:hypothetical protein
MWATSASGCSCVNAIPSGVSSVLETDGTVEDRRFTRAGAAERDDADFMCGLRMDDRHGRAMQQADRDVTRFGIGESVVFESEGRAGEDPL